MSFVLPGHVITSEQGFLRGHGSYLRDNLGNSHDESDDEVGDTLVAAAAGVIERVNKLVAVKPIHSRYAGEVGDLVVGRVVSVEAKRWKVDIASHKDANLPLSSVNLPGGVQRMRTHEDQMHMRAFFTDGDLVSAEIQSVGADGLVSLHTRSLRYGKLENGQFVMVPAGLVKRLPQHYVSTSWGLDVLLGRNGGIWITRAVPEEWRLAEGLESAAVASDGAPPDPEALQRLQLRHASTPITANERSRIARTRNAIVLLSQRERVISPNTIARVYERSIQLGLAPKDMMSPLVAQSILEFQRTEAS